MINILSNNPLMKKVKIALVFSLLSLMLGGYFYIQHLSSKVDVLQENNTKLELSIQMQQDVIDNMEYDISQVKGYYKRFQNLQTEQANKIEDLRQQFNTTSNGKDRSLGELAVAKPELIKTRVNNGTKDVNRCLEIITGAEVQEGESDVCK